MPPRYFVFGKTLKNLLFMFWVFWWASDGETREVIGNEYSQAFPCGCTLSPLLGTRVLATPCVLVTGWGTWTLPWMRETSESVRDHEHTPSYGSTCDRVGSG